MILSINPPQKATETKSDQRRPIHTHLTAEPTIKRSEVVVLPLTYKSPIVALLH